MNIDIFSCKDFDDKQAIEDMKEKFGLARIKTYVLGRGLQDAPIEMAQIKSA